MDNLIKQFNFLRKLFKKIEKKKSKGKRRDLLFIFSVIGNLKKWHAHKLEHPLASKNHFHLRIFDYSYPHYDKTRNLPITFQGAYFEKIWE